MRAFLIVWFGQVISMLGSAMTTFALTIWAYEITGSATALALVSFFSFGPAILFSPVAGALVDRWNRKLVMMLSDLGAGVSTIAVFILYSTGNLQIWHLYVAGAVSGVFAVFQWPAYSAAISTMLPKDQYARASGLLGLADSASNVFAPIFATALLVIIGISGVMIIDIVTFLFAVGSLLIIFVPQPEVSAAGTEAKGNLLSESVYGFRYIVRRPSLLALQLIFSFINLTGGFAYALVAPMLLARTGNNEAILATVQSLGAVGGIVGGLLLSVWGGPKRRIQGVLLGIVGASLFGHVFMGVGQVVLIWAFASFARAFFLPLLNGSNQAIWQAKVAPDVQGRVFAARRMIAQITGPLSILLAGPLADRIFEPAMQAGGSLTPLFGGLVGMGAGAGMGLMFLLAGVLSLVVGVGGYMLPIVRNAEDLLPDHETAPAVAIASAPPLVEDAPHQVPVAEFTAADPIPQFAVDEDDFAEDETVVSPATLAARAGTLTWEEDVQTFAAQLADEVLAHPTDATDDWLADEETVASSATRQVQSVTLAGMKEVQTVAPKWVDEAPVAQAGAAEDWLADEETAISSATRAARAVTPAEAQSLDRLILRLAEGGIVRQQIIKELRTLDPKIVPVLLVYANGEDASIRAGCASILGAFPSEAVVTALIGLLEDPDVRPRLNAAKSLGEIGSPMAVPALLCAIDDRSDLVGRTAIMALGDIKDPSALDPLLKRLCAEDNRLLKQGLIDALGAFRNPAAAPPLLDVFLRPQESEKMRDSAALALTLLGEPGKQALQTALLSGDAFARQVAKAYLRRQV